MKGASWRSLVSGLLVAVFLNAAGFRALTASALWPGLRGAGAAMTAAKSIPNPGQLTPARKLRRRRHETGQTALPPQAVQAAPEPSKVLKIPDPEGDSANSGQPSSLDHPPA